MSIHVVCGVNWGDEGKGRMVDYLAHEMDVVVRYQGGNNAGHTVANDRGTFKLHLVPSGIFNPNAVNVLGPGVVIDVEALVQEIERLEQAGVGPLNLKISDRAQITFPFHRNEDVWEEERLGKGAYGSTKRGIAPAYGDRYLKKALLMGELFYPEFLKERLRPVVEWKNAIATGVYGKPGNLTVDEAFDWAMRHGERLKPMITNTTRLLSEAAAAGKNIMFEAQLGALRDVFYGIYPFTTSSSALAAFAPVGSGLFGDGPGEVIGVMKAFSTCVGAGPFVTEMDESQAGPLRDSSGEFGTATGRPRRLGHFDALASRFGAEIQGNKAGDNEARQLERAIETADLHEVPLQRPVRYRFPSERRIGKRYRCLRSDGRLERGHHRMPALWGPAGRSAALCSAHRGTGRAFDPLRLRRTESRANGTALGGFGPARRAK